MNQRDIVPSDGRTSLLEPTDIAPPASAFEFPLDAGPLVNLFTHADHVPTRQPDPGAQAFAYVDLGLVEFTPIGAGEMTEKQFFATTAPVDQSFLTYLFGIGQIASAVQWAGPTGIQGNPYGDTSGNYLNADPISLAPTPPIAQADAVQNPSFTGDPSMINGG